jgi:hypothetical protein
MRAVLVFSSIRAAMRCARAGLAAFSVWLGIVASLAYGATAASAQEAPSMTSFEIAIPQEVLDDLAARLERTRLPDSIEGAGWDYGTNPEALEDLVAYWRDGFDWRAQEERLNAFDHFKAEVDGHGIHFVHVRSSREDAIPLLMLHGWPSSFVQMLATAPMLTEPEEGPAFHVVIPSLPGYSLVGIAQHIAAAPDGFDVVLAAAGSGSASCAACR